MIKQSRRKYIQEFREEALRLVTEQGYTSLPKLPGIWVLTPACYKMEK